MNRIMKTRNVLAGVLLASGGLFATGASAAPIAAWDWQTDGGFVDGASTCDNGAAPGACDLQYDNASGNTPSGIAGTSSVITWGEGTSLDGGNGQQSGLQGIFGSSSSTGFNAALLGSDEVPIPEFEQIVTNNGWYNTGAAVHYNNVITSEGGAMASSILRTSFQLTAPVAGDVNETDMDIAFNETLNVSPCEFPNPQGTVCDDIFTLSATLDPIVFTVGGQQYVASFQFAPGDGAQVIGDTIYTSETAPGTSTVFVQARIDTIPVPGVLALMGMGLMMIGWQVRGRRRKLV